MSGIADPEELELVRLAIFLGRQVSGCCEWQEAAARRIRQRPPLQGLTPEGIKRLLCEFVVDNNGEVSQVREQRPEYSDRRYYYKVIVPVVDLSRGLFVELILIDEDPEYPSVLIVNAHQQGR